MLQRMTFLAALAAGVLGLTTTAGVAQPEKKADQAKVEKALQEFQDYMGQWNLEGTQKTGAKTEAWKEKVTWGMKFKDGARVALTVKFESADGKAAGKYFTDGELTYDAETKKYTLTLNPTAKGEAKAEFVGEISKGSLLVARKDAKTGDVYRLTMNTLSSGDRFAVKYDKQEGGKGLYAAVYKMDGNKEGLAAAGGAKKPECIVSGGAASIAVSYNGKTYYVCCSGCRDEFNADPKKYAK